MTTAAIRKKLHNFIDCADDKKLSEFYALVDETGTSNLNYVTSKQSKMDLMKQAASDPMFLADVNDITGDFNFADAENI